MSLELKKLKPPENRKGLKWKKDNVDGHSSVASSSCRYPISNAKKHSTWKKYLLVSNKQLLFGDRGPTTQDVQKFNEQRVASGVFDSSFSFNKKSSSCVLSSVLKHQRENFQSAFIHLSSSQIFGASVAQSSLGGNFEPQDSPNYTQKQICW